MLKIEMKKLHFSCGFPGKNLVDARTALNLVTVVCGIFEMRRLKVLLGLRITGDHGDRRSDYQINRIPTKTKLGGSRRELEIEKSIPRWIKIASKEEKWDFNIVLDKHSHCLSG